MIPIEPCGTDSLIVPVLQRGEALCPRALRFPGEGTLIVELQTLVESDEDGRQGRTMAEDGGRKGTQRGHQPN